MPSFDHLTETALHSQPIFKGQIVEVSLDTVRLPDGRDATREVVRHCPAVCVLAVTEDDKVILVRQFRYPIGQVLLEVPAGKMDAQGESAADCALRELAEETPYTARSVEQIYQFYTAPGFCDELMYLFIAHDLQPNSQSQADDDEFVETVLMSRDEVKQSMRNGQIQDAKTLIALQYWLLMS